MFKDDFTVSRLTIILATNWTGNKLFFNLEWPN